MSATFHLSVVTPEREAMALEARHVAFPAYDGEMGILARRAPLLTKLGSGLLRVQPADGPERLLFVSGGFVQMVDDKLTLLTEEARELGSVDSELARRALSEASALPGKSDLEAEKRGRALARARALRRNVRSAD